MNQESLAVALVIGASSGYGQAIARQLKTRCQVVGASRTEGDRTAYDYWRHVDVTDPESVRYLQEGISEIAGGVDIVVYSAGIAIGKRHVEEVPMPDSTRVFQTNALGLIHTLTAFLPMLKESRGHFIHIGSIAAYLHYPGGADYCASKAAANSIMKSIRIELLGTGVRTTSIEPGLGRTNFQTARYNGDEELAGRHYAGIRILEPEDIARAVEFVLSAPDHVNVDEIIIKPLDQASHGITTQSQRF